jgi:predicted DNA-binding transcriptional regulator AlpA
MAKGEIPPPVKVGGASRLYESDLEDYMQRLKQKRNRLISHN